MATGKCKECSREISTKAKQCPHCGVLAKATPNCLYFCDWLVIGIIALTPMSSFWNDGLWAGSGEMNNASVPSLLLTSHSEAASWLPATSLRPVAAMQESESIELVLELEVQQLPDNRVLLTGKTNLPEGTSLMLSVEEQMDNRFRGQDKCQVSADGTFKGGPFGRPTGLEDGVYTANVTMPYPFTQSEGVQAIIGKKGERLSGPLLEKKDLGVTASVDKEFSIGGADAGKAQAEQADAAKETKDKIRMELCILLEELLAFKDKSDFRTYGFAVAGPYNGWKNRIESLRKAISDGAAPGIPFAIGVAAGDLELLGLEYLREKGETDYVRQILPEVKAAIDFDSYLTARTSGHAQTLETAESKPPSTTTPADDDSAARERVRSLLARRRTWRDNTGNFSVEAKLVKLDNGKVILEKKDGSTTDVPLSRLSEKDLEFLQQAYGPFDVSDN